MVHRILSLVLLLAVWCALSPAQTGLTLTEILWDIPSNPNGDPNGDGTRQSYGDEFVEIYNSSAADIDMSAYQIIEREKQVVFTFPVGAILPAKKFAVVFGNAITVDWGTAFPAGTVKFSCYTGSTNQGFGPVTTSTGSPKTNLASNGDRIMLVNSLLADTVAEVSWGFDNRTPPEPVIPLSSKGIYLYGPNTVKGDSIVGTIRQSVHIQSATGKWGLHTDVAGDTTKFYSPGAFAEAATAVEEPAGIGTPGVFQLHQNYPNPFNPSTVISFSIAREGQVRLNVYNLLGQTVASLLDKRLGAGLYLVNFDASSLPAGIYVYSLEAGSYKESRKMALVR
ncbi:MAG TPA: lamin tail domain-containing protein [Bacteroidota bacterium]|nr:lamin tail domain-containing protein [Bacteroidota bacterium]